VPRTSRILLLLGAGAAVCAAAAFLLQRRLQYFPDPGPVPLPQGARFAGLRSVRLASTDGTALEAWHWPAPGRPTLLLLHGNAGHRGHRLSWMEGFHRRGLAVFIVDYRGYGGSTGSPTEEGLYADAEAAAAWLAAEGPDPLVYVGSSMGAGVAVELALRRPPAAVILQNAAASLVDVGRRAYPFLPVGLVLRDRFEAARRIPRIAAPLLQFHAVDDEVVPIELGRRLFQAAPEPKRWIEVADARHNDLVEAAGPAYYDAIDRFLAEYLPAR
jgi:alpha-beta hydrolase superfamily lysophospholipase